VLDAGGLPGSSENGMLRLCPGYPRRCRPGLDDGNIEVLVKAVLHTSGQRQFPSAPWPPGHAGGGHASNRPSLQGRSWCVMPASGMRCTG